MNWLVFGAGAIGTYVGGSLALVGSAGSRAHKVVYVERPEVAAQIKQRGLRMNVDGLELTISDAAICASLAEAFAQGPFEIGLFALKSFDTRPALLGMEAFLEQLPPILCLQNGVENEQVLADTLGADRVIAGTVTSAVGRRAAGDITLEKKRGLGVADGHPLSRKVQAALDGAGLNARPYPKAGEMKWSKMLTNLLANASSAILNMTPSEIFSSREAYQLEIMMMREALQVMDALGYNVVDLPGTPVRLLAWGIRWLPVLFSQPLMKQFAGKGRGEKMPSLHIDLHSGRKRSEVDYLNGAVVRFGEQTRTATPVNRSLNTILMRLAAGEDDPIKYDHRPGLLLSRIQDTPGP